MEYVCDTSRGSVRHLTYDVLDHLWSYLDFVLKERVPQTRKVFVHLNELLTFQSVVSDDGILKHRISLNKFIGLDKYFLILGISDYVPINLDNLLHHEACEREEIVIKERDEHIKLSVSKLLDLIEILRPNVFEVPFLNKNICNTKITSNTKNEKLTKRWTERLSLSSKFLDRIVRLHTSKRLDSKLWIDLNVKRLFALTNIDVEEGVTIKNKFDVIQLKSVLKVHLVDAIDFSHVDGLSVTITLSSVNNTMDRGLMRALGIKDASGSIVIMCEEIDMSNTTELLNLLDMEHVSMFKFTLDSDLTNILMCSEDNPSNLVIELYMCYRDVNLWNWTENIHLNFLDGLSENGFFVSNGMVVDGKLYIVFENIKNDCFANDLNISLFSPNYSPSTNNLDILGSVKYPIEYVASNKNKGFTNSYCKHLFDVKEMLGKTITSFHNYLALSIILDSCNTVHK